MVDVEKIAALLKEAGSWILERSETTYEDNLSEKLFNAAKELEK